MLTKGKHVMEPKNTTWEESGFCLSQNFVYWLALLSCIIGNKVANGVCRQC